MTVRSGVGLALAAYVWWGLSPLYWKLLTDVDPWATVAWRIVATVLLMVIVQRALGRLGGVSALLARPRVVISGMVTATLIAANWGVFIWAVGEDRVTEASLGYFMQPLVAVLLAVIILRETLRRLQWGAVACAVAGVAWLTVQLGHPPWVSLVLAASFALYGLLKKTGTAGPLDGLTIETAVLAGPAVAFLAIGGTGGGRSGLSGGESLALIGTGVITAVPLVLFAAAARQIPLAVVGIMQYVNPTIQFLLGVVVFGEVFTAAQAVGYALVWAGLALFALDLAREPAPTVTPPHPSSTASTG